MPARAPTTAGPPSGWSTSALASLSLNPQDAASTSSIAASSLGNVPGVILDSNLTLSNNTESITGKPNELKATDSVPIPPFNVPAGEVRNKNERVEIRLTLDRSTFVAEGEVTGRVDILCKKDIGVKLGEIAVYLCGFEEVNSPTSPKEPQRRLFLSRCKPLQSPLLAPTEAVVAGIPDEHGMWNARKGVTSFAFKLRVSNVVGGQPQDPTSRSAPLPSSFWCPKVGGVRYVVSATTRVKLGIKEPNYLGAYREIEVIEHAPCHLAPTFTSSPSLTAETCVEVGGWMRSSRGEVTLRAECHVPDAGQESGTVAGSWVAGGIAFVTVNIQNASKRKIRSIKLALVRRLKTFVRAEAPTQTSSSLDSVDDTTSDAPVLSPVHFSRRIVAEKEFLSGRSERSSAVSVYAKPSGSWTEDVGGSNIVKWNGWWHGIKPSEKRRMMLDIFVPIHTRSIRFGITVDVSYVLQVSATPRGCPPVVVEIPVTVLHPASLLTSLPRLIAPVCKESPIVSSVVKVRTETSEAIEEDGVFHASSLVASGTIKSMESDGAKSSGKLVPSLVEGQTGYDIVDVTEFPLDDEPILSRHTTIFPTNHTGSTLESYSPRRPSTSDSLSSLSRTGTVVIKQTETPSRHVTLDRHRTIITQSTPQFYDLPPTPPSNARASVSTVVVDSGRPSGVVRTAGSLKRTLPPSSPPQLPLVVPVSTRSPRVADNKGTWKASMLNELVELKKSLGGENAEREGEVDDDEDDSDASDASSDGTDKDEDEEKTKLTKLDLKLDKTPQVMEIERAIDDLFRNLES